MPKTYLPYQKQKWLEFFEKGKSEKWIANYTKCDYRTVKKGIQEARQERNGIAAQVELVKEALTDHKNQLLTVLDEMRLMVVMPQDDLEIRTLANGRVAPISLIRARMSSDEIGNLVLDVPTEETVAWELIQEHLKGDKLWKSYKDWKLAVLTHMKDRINLKSRAEEFIKNETGLNISEKPSGIDETAHVYSLTVQLFYEVAIRRSLNIPDATNLEGRMIASADGYVRFNEGGSILAYAPNKSDKSRKALASAIESLYRSSQVEELSISYARLQEITNKTRRIIDEIALLHMLPGSCRVCRRLGVK